MAQISFSTGKLTSEFVKHCERPARRTDKYYIRFEGYLGFRESATNHANPHLPAASFTSRTFASFPAFGTDNPYTQYPKPP